MENVKNNENGQKLLNALGKNVAMAVQSLELIMPEVSDENFKKYLSVNHLRKF